MIDGYSLLRRDRVGKRKGGGLCAYVRQSMNASVIRVNDDVTDPSVEIMWFKCDYNSISVIVCLCYYPPKPLHDVNAFVNQLSCNIDSVIDNFKCDFIVIFGDFNTLDTDFLCIEYGFEQLVDQPTHGLNILDKMFINRPGLYECTVCNSAVKTKHKAIIAQHKDSTLPSLVNIESKSRTRFQVYDLRPHNIDYLRYVIGTFDWSFLYDIDDVDNMYCQFVDTVKALINNCIPFKTVRIRSNEPYYITPLVKSLLDKRNRLRRTGRIHEADVVAETVNKMIVSLQAKRLSDLSTATPKELWNAVKSCSGQSNTSNPQSEFLRNPNAVNQYFAKISTNDNYDISEVNKLRSNANSTQDISTNYSFPRLADYEIEVLLRRLKNTSPGFDNIPCWLFKNCSFEIAGIVSHIIRRTFETGTVPGNWLTAVVTPIPKTSNPKSLGEFRPISVTPILSRLTEKIIVQRCLIPAMDENMLRDQFAYRRTGSTTCALIKTLDFITGALENNSRVNCIFLDFSKAFDTVDHTILIPKINRLQISPNIKNWIISFLTNRSQIVKINGQFSEKIAINMGIVQGSSLGPTLFTIMASDLRPVSDQNEIVKYADDMIVMIPEDSEDSASAEVLNYASWAIGNKLTINLLKTKLLIVVKTFLVESTLSCFDEIELVTVFKLLGILIDSKLNFNCHVSAVLAQCSQRFYLLKLLKHRGLGLKLLSMIFQSLIVNKISYGISAWGGHIKQFDIDKINSMFRKGKRFGYTDEIYDYHGLLSYYDNALFNCIQNQSHCLFHMLPDITEHGKRTRRHNYELPICLSNLHKQSFFPRALYSFI